MILSAQYQSLDMHSFLCVQQEKINLLTSWLIEKGSLFSHVRVYQECLTFERDIATYHIRLCILSFCLPNFLLNNLSTETFSLFEVSMVYDIRNNGKVADVQSSQCEKSYLNISQLDLLHQCCQLSLKFITWNLWFRTSINKCQCRIVTGLL